MEKSSGRQSIYYDNSINKNNDNNNLYRGQAQRNHNKELKRFDKLYVLKDFRIKNMLNEEDEEDDEDDDDDDDDEDEDDTQKKKQKKKKKKKKKEKEKQSSSTKQQQLPPSIDQDSINDELNLIRSLSHPFIARLRGDFALNMPLRHYFIYDYYPGGTLRMMLTNTKKGMYDGKGVIRQNGRIPERNACAYFAQCILAMFYLHSNNIYIKTFDPKHILIDRHGHIKLTHFGYRYDNIDGNGNRNNILYLAPELLMSKQWLNSRKIHRQRDMKSLVETDYWSLGVLIYELFCGTYPFTTDGKLIDCTKKKEIKEIRLRILRASYVIREKDILPDAITYINSLLVLNPAERSAVFQDYHGNHSTVQALVLQAKKDMWYKAGIVSKKFLYISTICIFFHYKKKKNYYYIIHHTNIYIYIFSLNSLIILNSLYMKWKYNVTIKIKIIAISM